MVSEGPGKGVKGCAIGYAEKDLTPVNYDKTGLSDTMCGLLNVPSKSITGVYRGILDQLVPFESPTPFEQQTLSDPFSTVALLINVVTLEIASIQ